MEGDETRTLATRRDYALERDQESVPARERRTLSWLDLGEPCADLRSFHSPHNTTHRLVAPRSPPRRTPSLPLENIGRIIESAYPVYSDDGGERRERRQFLLVTSLVCRAWTAFAQSALWKCVILPDAESLGLLVGGGARRYPIEVLKVSPRTGPWCCRITPADCPRCAGHGTTGYAP